MRRRVCLLTSAPCARARVCKVGVPAVGFSPMPNTPILLHEHNEALSVQTFLDGVRTYVHVVEALAAAELQPAEADGADGVGSGVDVDASLAGGTARRRERNGAKRPRPP